VQKGQNELQKVLKKRRFWATKPNLCVEKGRRMGEHKGATRGSILDQHFYSIRDRRPWLASRQ
jgi:hypothetical protein